MCPGSNFYIGNLVPGSMRYGCCTCNGGTDAGGLNKHLVAVTVQCSPSFNITVCPGSLKFTFAHRQPSGRNYAICTGKLVHWQHGAWNYAIWLLNWQWKN